MAREIEIKKIVIPFVLSLIGVWNPSVSASPMGTVKLPKIVVEEGAEDPDCAKIAGRQIRKILMKSRKLAITRDLFVQELTQSVDYHVVTTIATADPYGKRIEFDVRTFGMAVGDEDCQVMKYRDYPYGPWDDALY